MNKFAKILAVALLAIMCLTVFTACAPNSDPDKALANLIEKGYKGNKDDGILTGIASLGLKGLKCIVTGTKSVETEDGETKLEHVTIYYFYDADSAQAAFTKLQDKSEGEKEDDTDWVFAQSGAMVYNGTKAAVSAASSLF